MIEFLILGAAIALIARRKQAGVGKVKVWQCIEKAQQSGVSFGDKWGSLSNDEQQIMNLIAEDADYRQTARSRESGKGRGEAFYNYLNGKYKSVAGLGKVVIDYPYVESRIKNEYGDLVLLHRDYDRERDIKEAVNAVDDMLTTDSAVNGYYLTLQYIARGGKVVWKSEKKGGSVIKRGLEDELFGSGGRNVLTTGAKNFSHSEERRIKRKILGSEKSGAKYPEQLAEEFAQRYGGDDHYYRDGVLDALLQTNSKQQAQEELLSLFYETFYKKEVPDSESDYIDMPF